MKPFVHAINSAKKYGGVPQDYLDIHNFMDISKSAHPDMRHRTILHHSLGCYITERMFGFPYQLMENLSKKFDWSEEEQLAIQDLLNKARSDGTTSIINSDGRRVEIRDIAEMHCIEDQGRIPTVSDYLDKMNFTGLLNGTTSTRLKVVD